MAAKADPEVSDARLGELADGVRGMSRGEQRALVAEVQTARAGYGWRPIAEWAPAMGEVELYFPGRPAGMNRGRGHAQYPMRKIDSPTSYPHRRPTHFRLLTAPPG